MLVTSSEFRLAGSEYSAGSNINMRLLTFLATGNYLQEQDLELEDLFRCGLRGQTAVSIGDNLRVQCDYDFNHLYEQLSARGRGAG